MVPSCLSGPFRILDMKNAVSSGIRYGSLSKIYSIKNAAEWMSAHKACGKDDDNKLDVLLLYLTHRRRDTD